MQTKGFSLKQATIHLLLWIAYILYESLLFIVMDARKLNLWETGMNFMVYAGVFYLNSLVLWPRYYTTHKYIQLAFYLILLIVVSLLLRYIVNRYVVPELGGGSMLRPVDLTDGEKIKIFIAESIWRLIYFVMISFVYFFASSAIKHERDLRLLEENKRKQDIQLLEIEKNLKEAEINFLKTQINPHFLFNSLNFFYAQVYPLSENLAKGILLLSDIMRYALKEDSVNGKVMLEDELRHLQNYISINQLRFNHTLQIHFEVIGKSQFRMVMPLLLITFVENCFKHGELLDPDWPLIIRLEITQDQLILYTRNKKKSGHKEKSTGIGLTNTRKRLDLLYQNRYDLYVEDHPKYYITQLTLNL